MAMSPISGLASADLGLGSSLAQQIEDETEEEKRKKRLGASPLQDSVAQTLGFGMTGVAPVKMS